MGSLVASPGVEDGSMVKRVSSPDTGAGIPELRHAFAENKLYTDGRSHEYEKRDDAAHVWPVEHHLLTHAFVPSRMPDKPRSSQ